MKDALEAIVLGIVQGLTEFLPVSSSGHLEIVKWLLGEEVNPTTSLFMTVFLHLATALATIVVFRKDIQKIIFNLFGAAKEDRVFAYKIILSMIPAVIIGLGFEDLIETLFDKQIILVGVSLILTGLLLFWADRPYTHTRSLGYKEALWMGIAQAIAILPGISRSGATIGTALLLKVDRSEAARFSFLMVVPLILGKVSKDLLGGEMTRISSTEWLPLAAGFIAAFLTGWVACKWMIRIVQQAKLRYFAYYCLLIGSLAILAKVIWI